jgi:RNA polymerase sigma-70 factor (ECF subfamily)
MAHAGKDWGLRETPIPLGESEFELVFRREYPGIYRLAFRILGTRSEAEDVAQEAFLRLHRKGPGSRAHVRPWIYRVAMNLSFNARRDRGRRRDREARGEIRIAEDAEAQRTLEREEERAAVRRVLSGLPERQARILLLRHSGLSYGEVAEALDVAAGSVGTLLARAEKAFEEAYLRRPAGDDLPSSPIEEGDRA